MDKDNKKEMKKTGETRLAVFTCIVAVILIICVQIAGIYLNLESFIKRETASANFDEDLQFSLDQLAYSLDDASEIDRKEALADTYFKALSLKDVKNDNELKNSVDYFGTSYVVKVKDGKVIFPEGAEVFPWLTADVLKEGQGIVEAGDDSECRYFAAFSSIGNDYYAGEVKYSSNGSDNMASVALYEIESAFDGKAILIDENGKYVYYSTELDLPDFHDSNGFNREDFNAYVEKQAPYYVMATSTDGRYTLVLFISRASVLSDSLNVCLLVTLVAVLLAVVLIVWISEVRKFLVRRKSKTEIINRYHPSIIKHKIRTATVLTVAAVLFTGMFSSAIGSLYSVTWDSQNTLSAVEEMTTEHKSIVKYKVERMNALDSEHARIIADAIYKDPKLRTKKNLSAFREILSANYIMVYDSEGREILTDSPYINMNIGGLSTSEMHTFRRVLNGEAEAYLNNVTDNVTGVKSDLIGVRMPSISEENPDGYNLLVISFPPSVDRGVSFFPDSSDLVASLVSSYNGFMLLDKNRKIKFMSNKYLYGRDPLELGMKEDEIRDNFMGEFELDNDTYYGASDEIDGEMYYYIAKSSVMRQGMLAFGLIEALGFLLVLMVVFRIILKDYDTIYEESLSEEEGQVAVTEAGSSGWLSKFSWIKKADTPEAKAKTVLNILGGLFILIIGILAINSAGADQRDSLIPFIFSDNWNRGINLFAVARILFMVCGVAVIWSIISFIISVAASMLDVRGATVAKLLKNVLSYVVVVFVVYYAALYLGFDPATLLASIGIIGLAVSLGVKDIIADVFSGVSLIFEKAFQVGDIVEIDGLVKGTVQELGVRTIKLLGDDNNLKVVRYSDIHKINNLSRSNSWCIAEFTVKNDVDTAELKKLLDEELPKINERHKEIISDPVFTGISSINTGSITFGVRAECRESKLRKVHSILNYEIRDLIKRNDIELL